RDLAVGHRAGRPGPQLAAARGGAVGVEVAMIIGAIRRSIRLKMMLVMIVSTFSALLITAVLLVAYDLRSDERAAERDLPTQADLVGRATVAALVFDDSLAAHQSLALLQARPRITAAAIYDRG